MTAIVRLTHADVATMIQLLATEPAQYTLDDPEEASEFTALTLAREFHSALQATPIRRLIVLRLDESAIYYLISFTADQTRHNAPSPYPTLHAALCAAVRPTRRPRSLWLL